MAGSLNKVMIIGNLGSDPELKTVGDSQVANFSVATSETYKDGSGNSQEKTEWHRIVAWGKQAELAGRFLSKGRKVFLEGSLQTRSWDDKTSGQKRYMTEIKAYKITFLDKAEGGDAGGGGGGGHGGGGYGGGAPQGGGYGGGAPQGGGQGYGAQQGGYAPPAQGQGYGAPHGQQGGYAPPQGQQGGQGYGAPQGGYRPPQGAPQGQPQGGPQGGDPGYFSDDDIPF